MIIGRGLLGKALREIDSEKYLFYANGISNSVIGQIPEENFESREIQELHKNIEDKIFIYFSTSQVNAPENFARPYVQHKIRMERLISSSFSNFLVVRTSNLVGNNPWNEHTLFNYLCNALKDGREITVNDSIVRNILDVDHFLILFKYYLTHFLTGNTVIDLINPVSFKMKDILSAFENIFSRKFLTKINGDSFAHFEATSEMTLKLTEYCEISWENYLSSVIKKYYLPVFQTL